MKNSDKMIELIEKTKNYLLSLSKEELNRLIEDNEDNSFGEMLIEAGFLEKEPERYYCYVCKEEITEEQDEQYEGCCGMWHKLNAEESYDDC